MTAVRDPYPESLSEIDEATLGFAPASDTDVLVRAVNRLAQAIEQNTLAILDNGSRTFQNAPQAALAALPPVRTAPVQNGGVCPIHGTPWKVVPAGISKKTGNAYDAFQACSTKGCDQRPPR